MSVAEEYLRQLQWRDWQTALDALPALDGAVVADLGCGVGDQALLLSQRGARVLAYDGSAELLAVARNRKLENVDFCHLELSKFGRSEAERQERKGRAFDGIWCSFVAAYLIDLPSVLRRWSEALVPGGWIALVEVDDLFGHEPLLARTKELIESYEKEALTNRRYDFRKGRRLAQELASAGLLVETSQILEDREFSFQGGATSDVLAAWQQRFERMKLLQEICGHEFQAVRDDFLGALSRPDHRSECRVHFCVASKGAGGQ